MVQANSLRGLSGTGLQAYTAHSAVSARVVQARVQSDVQGDNQRAGNNANQGELILASDSAPRQRVLPASVDVANSMDANLGEPAGDSRQQRSAAYSFNDSVEYSRRAALDTYWSMQAHVLGKPPQRLVDVYV